MDETWFEVSKCCSVWILFDSTLSINGIIAEELEYLDDELNNGLDDDNIHDDDVNDGDLINDIVICRRGCFKYFHIFKIKENLHFFDFFSIFRFFSIFFKNDRFLSKIN